jgi:hypothetical protein
VRDALRALCRFGQSELPHALCEAISSRTVSFLQDLRRGLIKRERLSGRERIQPDARLAYLRVMALEKRKAPCKLITRESEHRRNWQARYQGLDGIAAAVPVPPLRRLA